MPGAFDEYLLLLQFGPAVIRSVPVLVIDMHDDSMKIKFASKLLTDMFGYQPGELEGKELCNLLLPEHRDLHLQHFKRFQQAPADRPMNAGVWVDALKKSGEKIKVQISLCVQPVGRLDCVLACVADVTKAYLHMVPEIKRESV